MLTVSMLRETIIASLSAVITVPLLWLLGATINPQRNVHEPGLDLAIMTIVGAVAVLLLRSTWRDSAPVPAAQDRRPIARPQHDPGTSGKCGRSWQ
jgi:hypothetical protein